MKKGSDMDDYKPGETRELSLGRYNLLQQIGSGSTGRIFKAYDPQLDRIVALKLLTSINPTNIERFLREAKATARLRHPNIVSIYDIGSVKGFNFFTMDLVEGMSMAQLLKQTPLSLQQIVDIMTKVGEAVHYAHLNGIVHRDLKPSNIMIAKNYEPMVMDFGIAKLVHEDDSISKSGSIVGTFEYMAPEQAQGLSDEIDERTDIYALGAVLYEMLTGRPPFSGSNAWNVLYQIESASIVPPTQVNPDIPPSIENICLKALSKENRDRYASVSEWNQELLKFSRGKTIKITSYRAYQRAAKKEEPPPRKRLLPFYALAFALFFTTSFCVYLLMQGGSKKDEKHLSLPKPISVIKIEAPIGLAEKGTADVPSSAHSLLLKGSIEGSASITRVLLNGSPAEWDAKGRRFSGEIFLDYGNNKVHVLVLHPHHWLEKEYRIFRHKADVPARKQESQVIPNAAFDLSAEHRARKKIDSLMQWFKGNNKRATLGLIKECITHTIGFGAPAYNMGHRQACYEFYVETARSLCHHFGRRKSCSPSAREALEILDDVLKKCDGLKTSDEKAWHLRFAFDQILLLWQTRLLYLQQLTISGENYGKTRTETLFSQGAEHYFWGAALALEELVVEQIESVDVKNRASLFALTSVFFSQRKFKQAAEAALLGLRFFPEISKRNVERHFFMTSPEEYEMVLDELKAKVAENPDDVSLQFLLGYEYFLIKRDSLAQRHLNAALKLFPSHPGAICLMDCLQKK